MILPRPHAAMGESYPMGDSPTRISTKSAIIPGRAIDPKASWGLEGRIHRIREAPTVLSPRDFKNARTTASSPRWNVAATDPIPASSGACGNIRWTSTRTGTAAAGTGSDLSPGRSYSTGDEKVEKIRDKGLSAEFRPQLVDRTRLARRGAASLGHERGTVGGRAWISPTADRSRMVRNRLGEMAEAGGPLDRRFMGKWMASKYVTLRRERGNRNRTGPTGGNQRLQPVRKSVTDQAVRVFQVEPSGSRGRLE